MIYICLVNIFSRRLLEIMHIIIMSKPAGVLKGRQAAEHLALNTIN